MGAIDRMISGLGKRQFLLHNTREPEPSVFTTRWAMSYLRGPLTREEVDRLTDHEAQPAAPARESTPAQPPPAEDEVPVAPEVAPRIPVFYLDVAAPWSRLVEADPAGTRLEPMIAARIDLVYDETRADLRHDQTWEAIFYPLSGRFDASEAVVVDYDERDFREEVPDGARYALTEAPIDSPQFWATVTSELKDYLYRNASIEVFRNAELKLYSRVGETEQEFQERCDRAAEEHADEEVAKVRERLEARLDRAKEQLATAHRRMQELEIDTETRKRDEWLSGAGDVLGVLLGGRRTRSLSGASRRRSQTQRTEQRLRSAQAKVQDKADDIAELEEGLVLEIEEINDKWEDIAAAIDTIEVGLEKNDINVNEVALVWVRK
jgi:hypothetical protein